MLRITLDLPTLATTPIKLEGWDIAAKFFKSIIDESRRELLLVMFFDDHCDALGLSTYVGFADRVEFSIPRITKDVVSFDCCSGLIMAHTHPSGIAAPSEADIDATKKVYLALEPHHCVILDHMIFGSGEWFSFRRHGLL